jgi:hypothetical protein
VIDVSLRREPSPHGTGFVVEGGDVVTAAHVVFRPDRLKLTSRSGQTVDADVVRIDEVRDIAILHPRTPLKGVPAVPLETRAVAVGEPVWALGHTGHGVWALSWGMSEGIASGFVDMFGARLLLFDAAVYPGFSGGPVVTVDADGKAHVVGVNHAILYTGGSIIPMAPISSAIAVSEIRDVIAGKSPAFESVLSDYANRQRMRVYADVFFTQHLDVGRDSNGQQIAHMIGHAHAVANDKEPTRIPAVATVFGLLPGDHTVVFEAKDPRGELVASSSSPVKVETGQRVTFVAGSVRLDTGVHGKLEVVVKVDKQALGHAYVSVEDEHADDDLVDDHEDDADCIGPAGEPDVDVIVATLANEEPLVLSGIRGGWSEASYPRRVPYTWFVRGTRGWSGTDVSISAYVLDEKGKIVGRTDGCFRPELRPERGWSCVNAASMREMGPLAMRAGHYDIVFAIHDRPIAWWPMDATIRKDLAPGTEVERWIEEMKKKKVEKK